MSVEAMAIVLHHSKATGTKKLVLLGIANHDGDGGAWPAIATLAKYANVDDRNVRRAIDSLAGDGELSVVVHGGGMPDHRNDRRPNRYEILVTCPPDCDRTRNHRTRGGAGARSSVDGGALAPERPGAGARDGGALAPPEPSLEPPSEPRGSRSWGTSPGVIGECPPLFCPDHPAGTARPCRACAAVTLDRIEWERARDRARDLAKHEALEAADREARMTAGEPRIDELRQAVRKRRRAAWDDGSPEARRRNGLG